MPIDNVRFWDRMARKYAASPISDMGGYERTLVHARRYLKDTDSAIEFGCGTGTTALRLAPAVAHYLATDISSEMITIGREKAAAEGVPNIEFAVAAPETAPYPDASFDAALCFNLLHLIEDRAAALRGVHRMLKPGGVFISKTPALTEINFMIRLAVPLMQAIGKAPYVAFFSNEALGREIAAAGFEIVERAHHGSGKRDMRTFFVARKT
ncbi:MAG: class I SAM-dependent methyltransferase [Hyphomonadaceae bacterium]|nr:class I SAM-dependent methyltransferase [Hyphomonadaceae bacterium]